MEGLSNKEIAAKLFISVHTVKANLEHIYEKLNISNIVLLALYVYNVDKKLKEVGFKYVTLDTSGYEMGSMNK